jgi:pimeloyl-ACP methyl ester carboxylesterase
MKHARASAAMLLLGAAGGVFAPAAAATPGLGASPGASQGQACQNDFGTKTPVLLVHGFHEKTDVWASLTKAIQRDVPNAAVIPPFDYPSTQWVTDRDVAPKLAAVISCLAADSARNGGPGKIIIVAHSMGGLAVRCAVSAACVKSAAASPAQVGLEITLGTPNTGSLLATAGNGLSDAGQVSCEAILFIENGLTLPCPDVLGWLFGANTPAARALEDGVNGKPSPAIASLPALPSTVPLDAIAGQVTVTTSLFQLGTFRITGQLADLGDLVVSEASALDDAPPTSPAHPGTSAQHPGHGAGAVTVPCGTVSVATLAGVGPPVPPSVTCWHNTETTNATWQADVLSAISDAVTAFGPAPCTAAAMVSAINAAHSPNAGPGQWYLNSYACASGYASVVVSPVPSGLDIGAFLKRQGGAWKVIFGPTEGICLAQQPTGICQGFKQPIPLSLQRKLAQLSAAGQLPELYVNNLEEPGALFGYPNFPSSIGLSPTDSLSKLDWSQVSPSGATATGSLNLNNCAPSCAASTSFTTVPIRLQASKPRQCTVYVYPQGISTPQQSGAYVFDQLEVTAVNGAPLPAGLSGRSPFDLPAACG